MLAGPVVNTGRRHTQRCTRQSSQTTIKTETLQSSWRDTCNCYGSELAPVWSPQCTSCHLLLTSLHRAKSGNSTQAHLGRTLSQTLSLNISESLQPASKKASQRVEDKTTTVNHDYRVISSGWLHTSIHAACVCSCNLNVLVLQCSANTKVKRLGADCCNTASSPVCGLCRLCHTHTNHHPSEEEKDKLSESNFS